MAAVTCPAAPPGAPAPRLLDQVRQLALAPFGRPEPAERFAGWTRRFVLFHGKRHPRERGAADVGRFREHVAPTEQDPLTGLAPAHQALTFRYDRVLGLTVGVLPLPQPPRLLDRLRRALRVRHYAPRTKACYVM